jgi:hypothetical protein
MELLWYSQIVHLAIRACCKRAIPWRAIEIFENYRK